MYQDQDTERFDDIVKPFLPRPYTPLPPTGERLKINFRLPC